MFNTILVIAEQQHGHLTQLSLETVGAAQQLPSKKLIVALLGHGLQSSIESMHLLAIDELCSIDHPTLDVYNNEIYKTALLQLMTSYQADLLMLPHSYQSRDLMPAVATYYKRSIISDVITIKSPDTKPVFVRDLFQGRLCADIELLNDGETAFVSVQTGCFPAAISDKNRAPCVQKFIDLESLLLADEEATTRLQCAPPVKGTQGNIKLDDAEIIVAVGRGIKSQENIAMVQQFANLLNAELAASRPICDEGWLPSERQIGSSGQTVSPRIYFALGISGAIQHIIGMKSSTTIVAINNDPHAPIFDIADFGIVADLFDIVPALILELESRGSQ